MMLPRARRPDTARRQAGLAMALVLCVGQVVALVHASLVSHSTCAEHGEMVHGHAGPVAAAPASAGHSQVATQPSSLLEDEHCTTWSSFRPSLEMPAPLLAIQRPALSTQAPVSPGLVSALVRHFRLAPKQSPPA